MPAKWQRLNIEIPREYSPQEREAIAFEVIEFIRDRTQKKNVDKDGNSFPKYSKSYAESLDFKIAGKSKGKVDLTLSGDMLGALDLLSHRSGKITIGFEKGSDENARADGNIRGTYGQSSSTGAKRDFLGISEKELSSILRKYPLEDREKAKSRAERFTSRAEVDVDLEGDDGN